MNIKTPKKRKKCITSYFTLVKGANAYLIARYYLIPIDSGWAVL